MNKEEAVKLMVESFNKDNYTMALASGMPEEEIKKNFDNSLHSIEFMLSNIYDLLVTNNVIKKD